MKKVFLLFVVFGVAYAIQAQTNLIPNGDFSEWRDNVPKGFMLDVTAGASDYFAKSSETYEGKGALAMSYLNNGANPVRMFMTPSLSLTKGFYTLSFVLKGEGYLKMVTLSSSTASRDERIDLKSASTTNIMNWRPQGQETSTKALSTWTSYNTEVDEPVDIYIAEAGEYQFNFCHNNGKVSDGKSYVLHIADIMLTKEGGSSIDSANGDQLKVRQSGHIVEIESEGENVFSIYDIKSKLIESGTFVGAKKIDLVHPGLYFLKVNNIVRKILIL